MECNSRLPQFNRYLLKEFREEQIRRCISFTEMAFEEATRLFHGRVRYEGSRVLSPEDRIQLTLNNPRNRAPSVEIAPTELMLVSFDFRYDGTPFSIPLYMPYLKDDCMVINGSQYYIQFALTDRAFYHISKENGLGIKVLRAHLRFWRNQKHNFTSVNGIRYADQVVIVKIHQRVYKHTTDDLKTALLLYPLSMMGWKATLNRYGIDERQIQFVGHVNREDVDNEYFQIRKATDSQEGLFVKIDKAILATNPDETNRVQMRVVTSLMYILQYFTKAPTTMYQNNVELRSLLTSENDFTVWQAILGRAIYGINYGESQGCGHAVQHLDSLMTYLDPHTKIKLSEIGVDCRDIHDLIDYVFINMDSHVVNYTPADLSDKRINIIDLLVGTVVRRLFVRIYSFTNNNRKNRTSTPQEVESLFRVGMKSFTQLQHAGSVVAVNPSRYNDNYLLAVGARKVRTTHSSTGGKSGDFGAARTKQQVNHLSSPDHIFHPSWLYVESCLVVSHTNPDSAGSINYFLPIDTKGNVIVADYAKEYRDQMLPFCITK